MTENPPEEVATTIEPRDIPKEDEPFQEMLRQSAFVLPDEIPDELLNPTPLEDLINEAPDDN